MKLEKVCLKEGEKLHRLNNQMTIHDKDKYFCCHEQECGYKVEIKGKNYCAYRKP